MRLIYITETEKMTRQNIVNIGYACEFWYGVMLVWGGGFTKII